MVGSLQPEEPEDAILSACQKLDYLMVEFAEVSGRRRESGNIDSMPRHSPKTTNKKMGSPITNEGGASTSGVGSQTASGVLPDLLLEFARADTSDCTKELPSEPVDFNVPTVDNDSNENLLMNDDSQKEDTVSASLQEQLTMDAQNGVMVCSSKLKRHSIPEEGREGSVSLQHNLSGSGPRAENKSQELHGSLNLFIFTDDDSIIIAVDSRLVQRHEVSSDTKHPKSESATKFLVLVDPSPSDYGVVVTGVGSWYRMNDVWSCLELLVHGDGERNIDTLADETVSFMMDFDPSKGETPSKFYLAGFSPKYKELVVYELRDRKNKEFETRLGKPLKICHRRSTKRYHAIGAGTDLARSCLEAELVDVERISHCRAVDVATKTMFITYLAEPSIGGYLSVYKITSTKEVSSYSTSLFVPVRRILAFEFFKEMHINPYSLFLYTSAPYDIVNHKRLASMIINQFKVSPKKIMCLGLFSEIWHGFLINFEYLSECNRIFASLPSQVSSFFREWKFLCEQEEVTITVARPKCELMHYLHAKGNLTGHPFG